MEWDPFESFKRMQLEMNRSFNERSAGRGFAQSPAMDLVDHGTELVAVMDLPGINKEDIKIHCTEEHLSVSAQSSGKAEEKRKDYYFSERSSSAFSRSVRLPAPVIPSKAKSTFKNGVLEIRLPKLKPEKHGSHTIKVD